MKNQTNQTVAKPKTAVKIKKTAKAKTKSKEKTMTLVIVESPTKAKTLYRYLDKNYKILASMGHIIDLPKSRMAVDTENGFKPDYITVRGRAKILNQLKKEAAKSKRVLLASDPDREGEAISYHLQHALENHNDNVQRIEFHEITKEAVQEAIASPRSINMNLFNAQQARRILDRLVGYNISPILWKKVKKGLSAGRVQSVALRIICEREKQIKDFIADEYWQISADLKSGLKRITAQLSSIDGKKAQINNEEQAQSICQQLNEGDFFVKDIRSSQRKRKPLPPYTTSKLQQDAATRFGYSSSKTMMIAQQLYEGVDLAGEGATGLITYMRTDSVRVSNQSLDRVRAYIKQNFKSEYLPPTANIYATKKGAQDAHEAIRPTDPMRSAESIKGSLTKDQYKLYAMIWSRFVSSQMTPELSEQKTLIIENQQFEFRASGKKVLFRGFTEVMSEIVATDEGKEKKDKIKSISDFKQGEKLTPQSIDPSQHFTSPPPRYNDASIVKKLEESGVGRPSTYAPTIGTLLKRYYVVREKRQLIPTELGMLVNTMLVDYFGDFVNLTFTANMEEKLDSIEAGNSGWVEMLDAFFKPFTKTLNHAIDQIVEMRDVLYEETEYNCEHCGKTMLKKIGRYGYFLACGGFPECKNAKPLPLGPCPIKECSGSVVKRSTKRGRPFYGCNRYPQCEFSTWDTPLKNAFCPQCGSLLFEKPGNKRGQETMIICNQPDCAYTISQEDFEKTDS